MNKKVFEKLDFLVRRRKFYEAIELVEELENKITVGSEEYGELCYYKLMTHYFADDKYTLKYKILRDRITHCELCDNVRKYSSSARQTTIYFPFIQVGTLRTPKDYYQSAEKSLEKKDYKSAIESFKIAGTEDCAVQAALIGADEAFKKGDFNTAIELLDYALYDDACYEKRESLRKYEQVYKDFQKEIGSPKKYAEKVLMEADSKTYSKYIKMHNRSGGYTDGIPHFVCVIIALVAAIGMFFDPNLDAPVLYVIWGVAASVALHKKNLWDFGIIKSIGGTFLLCAAPAFISAFADEVLDADRVGALAALVVTLIEFIPALIRNIRYGNASKSGKQAVALKLQFVEPTLKKARQKLVDKYAPLTDYTTASSWANTIKL